MNNTTNKRYVIILIAVLILGGIAAMAKLYIVPKYFSASINEAIKQTSNEVKKQASGLEKSTEALPSRQIDFALNASAYNPNDITVISNFEKTEENVWQGGGVIDEKVYYEGARSMSLISVDRNYTNISLEKKLDLSNMEQIEFMLHVTDADAFETVIMDFGDLDFKNYYRYTLSNLKNGWNLIQIPKGKFILAKAEDSTFDWSNVEKTRFYTLSRPASIFLVRIDMLRSINNSDDFLKQWRVLNGGMFFSLYEREGKPTLLARNIGASVATLKEIENIGNNIYSAAVSPQSSGRSGLFVRGDYNNTYGYYLLIGGEKNNNWQILKNNKAGWTPKEKIIEGVLANATFTRDKKYWLRAETRDDILEFYISFDGQKYEKLGELKDGEFRVGGIGIAVLDGGWSLFDDFQFKSL